MDKDKNMHGCGRVINPATGKEEVVVTGGRDVGGPSSSTVIYTVEDDTWRQGTPLPKTLEDPASLPYGDSFLLLGGNDGSSCHDSIYQVNTFIMSFVESYADMYLRHESGNGFVWVEFLWLTL